MALSASPPAATTRLLRAARTPEMHLSAVQAPRRARMRPSTTARASRSCGARWGPLGVGRGRYPAWTIAPYPSRSTTTAVASPRRCTARRGRCAAPTIRSERDGSRPPDAIAIEGRSVFDAGRHAVRRTAADPSSIGPGRLRLAFAGSVGRRRRPINVEREAAPDGLVRGWTLCGGRLSQLCGGNGGANEAFSGSRR